MAVAKKKSQTKVRKKNVAREIAIATKTSGGLNKQQINEVMSIIKSARQKGILPAMSYEYNDKGWLFGKDPVYLQPKNADVKRTAVIVRRLLPKYKVYLV